MHALNTLSGGWLGPLPRCCSVGTATTPPEILSSQKPFSGTWLCHGVVTWTELSPSFPPCLLPPSRHSSYWSGRKGKERSEAARFVLTWWGEELCGRRWGRAQCLTSQQCVRGATHSMSLHSASCWLPQGSCLPSVRERGVGPLGSCPLHLVRSADEDPVFHPVQVWVLGVRACLRPKETFPRNCSISGEETMPYFLNTLICFKYFLNFQKTFWIQHKKCCYVPVFLKSLIRKTSKDSDGTPQTTPGGLGFVPSSFNPVFNDDDQRSFWLSFILTKHQTFILFGYHIKT